MTNDTPTTRPDDLTGRTALVTGGGRGLGRAFALALAEQGCQVAVLARSAEQVEAVAREIGAAGGEAMAVAADIADHEQLVSAVAAVCEVLGEVDVLVNNAGVVWPLGRFAEVDPQAWEQALAINVTGAFRLTQLVLPGMLERGWGRVVGVSSGAATGAGMPTANAYSVGKAGLDMLMRNLADEVEGTGVCVANLSPGTVDTDMQGEIRGTDRDTVDPDFHDRFTALHTDGDLTTPEMPTALLLAMLRTGVTAQTLDTRHGRGAELLGDRASGR